MTLNNVPSTEIRSKVLSDAILLHSIQGWGFLFMHGMKYAPLFSSISHLCLGFLRLLCIICKAINHFLSRIWLVSLI